VNDEEMVSKRPFQGSETQRNIEERDMK